MYSFQTIDWIIFFLYALSITYFGFFKVQNKPTSEKEFILSGRRLSVTGFVATLVTTWYGAILGIGENTLLFGIQTWFIFSFPYYIFAIIYAFWIAPRIKKSGALSIPEKFKTHYGDSAGLIAALIISFLSNPAPYILSLGILLEFLFGISLGVSLAIATLFSVLYIWNGGFSAVVRTDIFQFFLMFFGFFIMLIFLWLNIESPIVMVQKLPNIYTDPLGGNTIQYVLVWFFIASWTFIDPGFYQRCAAAESPLIAKRGILISICFWALFDLMSITAALYAVGYVSTEKALLTYPILAHKILPAGVFGLFITGILAILMSTIDSLSLVCAISFGRDILWRVDKDSDKMGSLIFVRRGLIIISLISLLLAYLLPSVVKLFYLLGSLLIPGLILPFLFTLKKNDNSDTKTLGATWLILPIFTTATWFVISKIIGKNIFSIEPFYSGMFTSVLYFIIKRKGANNGN
tara:strand:- start:2484 stop:3872 length:1389 start_codon:yes stop_codon:yes gene_type:complete